MNQLLVVDASARYSRSLSRQLTEHAVATFRKLSPSAHVVHRDVGRRPVPALDEAWIAAAFTPPAQHTAVDRAALAASEELVEELARADAVVFGAPIYNFGLPAQLKAWFDQIVRIGRTFDYGDSAAAPYRPLLRGQPVLVATAAGTTAMFPGGAWHDSNLLEPHLQALCAFVGLGAPQFVRIGGDEDPNTDRAQALQTARQQIEAEVDGWFASRR